MTPCIWHIARHHIYLLHSKHYTLHTTYDTQLLTTHFTTHRWQSVLWYYNWWQTVILYYTQVANSYTLLHTGGKQFCDTAAGDLHMGGTRHAAVPQEQWDRVWCLWWRLVHYVSGTFPSICMSMYLYVYVSSFIHARAQRERERETERGEREREREEEENIRYIHPTPPQLWILNSTKVYVHVYVICYHIYIIYIIS